MNSSTASQIISCPNCGANNRVAVKQQTDKQPVCGRCNHLLPNVLTQPVIVTDANFNRIVEKSALPILLDLWAAWCGPCRQIAPLIEQFAKEFAGKALVGKLNVDENRKTAARFNVQGIPTLLILQNGLEVDRIVGVESRESISRRLQKFVR
jgi:thioredoxin 2